MSALHTLRGQSAPSEERHVHGPATTDLSERPLRAWTQIPFAAGWRVPLCRQKTPSLGTSDSRRKAMLWRIRQRDWKHMDSMSLQINRQYKMENRVRVGGLPGPAKKCSAFRHALGELPPSLPGSSPRPTSAGDRQLGGEGAAGTSFISGQQILRSSVSRRWRDSYCSSCLTAALGRELRVDGNLGRVKVQHARRTPALCQSL